MKLQPEQEYLPHISYDTVIFGFCGEQLKVLLLKYRTTGHHALPGGFVKKTEDLEDAVCRGLRERTGLRNIYLEQFHTFGSRKRQDTSFMRTVLRANGMDPEPDYFMLDRFISVAYYALINYEEVNPQPDDMSDSIGWHDVAHLPELALDHREITDLALQTLRENLDRKLVGRNLLPERFTMKELQQVHEAILGEPLRRTTFQRKMLSLDILERHEKFYSGKAHKAPYLYSFK